MKRILIIEDDPAIVRGLEAALGEEHYTLLTAREGEKGYLMAKRENIDLIILDIVLPKKSGLDICKDLRKDEINTPILMLTSKKEEIDKVMGLEIGADDYVTKPFSLRELKARIHALLRRKAELKMEIDEYSFGTVDVDFKKQEANKNKRPIRLSSKEFDVLKFFIRHEGEVVTRHMLLDEVWGYEQDPTTRTVDNYILSLRKKIEDIPTKPKHLLTVHTTGYKFVK
ncbi:MAG: response regulator transcription factor [Ignavibacteriae bacterium]|nr:response regulator transcription factor [Ignavibacteria bacterium]MBI3365015.1 response regulator transcription factor [Ignavibacteriota bacterium]